MGSGSSKAAAEKAAAEKAAAEKAAAEKAAVEKAAAEKAAAEKAAAEKAAAEKGSDRHLYEAAGKGNEAELRRLIGLGWSVNWHNPEVRRRMCLAWAPASSSPLVLSPPRSPETAPYPHSSLYSARRRWLRHHPAAPPSLAHASSSHGARRTPACSPTLLACSGTR
jgi:pyruvate/2-oxoglutarate dehydrogenase complex dihydrolipoamide acyltransferase (E2) component